MHCKRQLALRGMCAFLRENWYTIRKSLVKPSLFSFGCQPLPHAQEGSLKGEGEYIKDDVLSVPPPSLSLLAFILVVSPY